MINDTVKSDSAAAANMSSKRVMSVHDMAELLGIKHNKCYWPIYNKKFLTVMVEGRLWIDIESFENWYANQDRYRKVTGEEPGALLRMTSYSPQDIADDLGITRNRAYAIIKKYKLETIFVHSYMRVPKEAYLKWYENQTYYQNKESRENNEELKRLTISIPEMAHHLGISKKRAYYILYRVCYSEFFVYHIIGNQKRIERKGFEAFLRSQQNYTLAPDSDYEFITSSSASEIAKEKRNRRARWHLQKEGENIKYLTRDEAAIIAGVSVNSISKMISKGCFPVIRRGSILRIPRLEFEAYLESKE